MLGLVLLTAPALAQRTAADVETARELYNSGRELKDKGDLRGALEKFKAAHALGRTPITGLELARAHIALGQPVDAREVCLSIARQPVTVEETSRSAEARIEAARLAEEVKSKIATLRVRIKGAPAGTEPSLTIDGVNVPAVALEQPRQVNPGTHTIVARVARGRETTASADLKEGEVREVEIAVEPPSEAGATRAGLGRGPSEHALSPLVIPGFAVAAVGVGVGVVTGTLALSAKSDLTAGCAGSQCGPDQHDTLDRARLMGNVSTVAFVVAGAGALVGIYGLTHPITVTARTAWVGVQVGVDHVGIHGSF
jgi:hypothetical protein